MEKKISLEEILADAIYIRLDGKGSEQAKRAVAKTSAKSGSSLFMIEAMKEACRQTLELAAENAECYSNSDDSRGDIKPNSITDTIEQIN